jgi:hypothetical protein
VVTGNLGRFRSSCNRASSDQPNDKADLSWPGKSTRLTHYPAANLLHAQSTQYVLHNLLAGRHFLGLAADTPP